MSDEVTYLITLYSVLGFMGGMFAYWFSSPKGQIWFKTKIQKKNAKLMRTWYPGHIEKEEVIVIGGTGLKVGANKETLLERWDDKNLPVFRPIGGNVQVLYRFKDEVGVFDPMKIERGIYKETEESKKILETVIPLKAKLNELKTAYEAAAEAKDLEKQNVLATEYNEIAESLSVLESKHTEARAWYRMPSLPPEAVTEQLRHERSKIIAEVLSGFLGKLEATIKSVQFIIIAMAVFSLISAIASGFVAFKIQSGG